jgi:hypothetical protein
MVGVVSAVTGRPPLVTGKPDPAMHAECMRRTGARRPLVVGDRLDTDIEGARRADTPSLLVFSGVTDARTLLAAGPEHRPDHIGVDASALLAIHPPVAGTPTGWRCGVWEVRPGTSGALLLVRTGDDELRTEGRSAAPDGLDGLRAVCVAHWSNHPDEGTAPRVLAGDGSAAAALEGWGLGPV